MPDEFNNTEAAESTPLVLSVWAAQDDQRLHGFELESAKCYDSWPGSPT
jgi:hypothetical protein